MPVEQKFYFPPYPLSYKIALIVVETELRINNNNTKCVVKLPKNDQQSYPQLEGLEVYDHESAVIKLQDAEWQPLEIDFDAE